MKVFGTEMTMVVFIITIMELFILIIQVVHYLERPSAQNRLWFLILLVLFVLYNITSGLFPDPKIPINQTFQIICAYTFAIANSWYFAYYLYKVYSLERLRRFAIFLPIYAVVVPFLVAFVIPYLITGDLVLSRRLFVVIPALYAIFFFYHVTMAFKEKFVDEAVDIYNLLSVYLAVFCWISLPFIVFFAGDVQVLEHSVTNLGFLIMSISYVRTIVKKSKRDYQNLIESREKFKTLSESLAETVDEKTNHLKLLIDQKTNAITNLAHEIKTPISIIAAYNEDYVQKHGSNKEFEIIRYNFNKIFRDITNIFRLEKYNAGYTDYDHSRTVNFSEILYHTIELFKAISAKKDIQIITHIEEDLLIKCDPKALDSVLNNLIENAIKYSSNAKSVFVNLRADDHKISFTVEDQGMGILPEELEKIFERHYQLDRKKSNASGMGLGLSIVKNIITSLDATIHVESEPTKGTKFTIDFKRFTNLENSKVVQHINRPLEYLDIEGVDTSDAINFDDKPAVLVVEDNLQLLQVLKSYLSKYYNVYVAQNGAHALDKMQQKIKIDLIISDVMMDILNGYEFYEYLSKDTRYGHIPFLFLTAKKDDGYKALGLEMGAIDYIEKPVKLDHLKKKIDAILGNINKHISAVIKQAYISIKDSEETRVVVEEHTIQRKCKSYNLTDKETEIGVLLVEGRSYKEISEALFIAPNTVKNHVAHIYKKVQVHNRTELFQQFMFS